MERTIPFLTLSIALAVAGAAPSDAAAQTFAIRKIADTATTVPGTSALFAIFPSDPCASQGSVVFHGISDVGTEGIYRDEGGELRAVADTRTELPGGGSFVGFGQLSFDGTGVAFRGFAAQDGIFLARGDSIQMVVSTETPIPGGSGSFTDFGGLALDGERVALQGSGAWVGSAQQQGVYLWAGGALATIADANTRIAGAAGGRLVGFAPELSASGGMVAFQGSSGFSQDGVYLHDGTSITVIADSRGSAGTRFTSFGMLSLEGRNVAFIGTDDSYSVALYVGDGSSLRAVHREGTSVPGGTESFLSFEAVSQHSSHVTFIGVGSTGIYTDLGGSLSKVITVGATLDGRTVSSISLGREAFHSDGIAFRAEFEDGTSGIFVAQPTS